MFKSMKVIIVSRHPGAVEWLREEYPELRDVPVFSGNVTSSDVIGKHVVGNIPLHLAAICETVFAIEFSGNPPRGAEYSAQDMRDAGADLSRYTIWETKYLQDFVSSESSLLVGQTTAKTINY